jgi:hypothetical protein
LTMSNCHPLFVCHVGAIMSASGEDTTKLLEFPALALSHVCLSKHPSIGVIGSLSTPSVSIVEDEGYKGALYFPGWTTLNAIPRGKGAPIRTRCMKGVKCVNSHILTLTGGKVVKKGGTVSKKNGFQCNTCTYTVDSPSCMPHACAHIQLKKMPIEVVHPTIAHKVVGSSVKVALALYECWGFILAPKMPQVFVLPEKPTQWDAEKWFETAVRITQDFVVFVNGKVVLAKVNDVCSPFVQAQCTEVMRRGYWLGGRVKRSASVTPSHAYTTCFGMRSSKGGSSVTGQYHNSNTHPKDVLPKDLQGAWQAMHDDPTLLSTLTQDMEVTAHMWYTQARKYVYGPLTTEEGTMAKHEGAKASYAMTFATACVTTHNYVSHPHIDKTDCDLTCTLYQEEETQFASGLAKQTFCMPSLGMSVDITPGCVIFWDPKMIHLTTHVVDSRGDELHPMGDEGVVHPRHKEYVLNEKIKARIYAWTLMQKPTLVEQVSKLWNEDYYKRRGARLVGYGENRVAMRLAREELSMV